MYVKITAAFWILSYGLPSHALDDYLDISDTTARSSLVHFSNSVIKTLGPQYLRDQTTEDIKVILYERSKRGLPGLLGSIES